MRIIYDQTTDRLTILLSEEAVAERDDERPGIILNFDDAGNLLAVEVLEASQQGIDPTRLLYELAGQPE